MNQNDENRLLRRSDVAKLLGIGQSTWSRWVSEGKAPPGIRLSSRAVAWRYSTILKFVEERAD
ncbi:AlpA family phage regulatory protein [Microbulbifer aggregans]|uniref:helix-turn-helix transcriptional regulator n=1 Tax=Microbulbifer aggregans TaxID=1769779 RepID=UPI0009F402F3